MIEPGTIIILEGSIASGKSTLGKSLNVFLQSQGYKSEYLAEFFDKDLLDYYIENKRTQAYSFQIIMIRERIRLFEEANRLIESGLDYVIIDRGLIGDICFAKMLYDDGSLSEREYGIYLGLATRIRVSEDVKKVIIYLKCDIDVIMERIKTRGIESEIKGYKSSYIYNLIDTHEKIFNSMKSSQSDLDEITKKLISFHKDHYKIIEVDYNQRVAATGGLINISEIFDVAKLFDSK